MLLLPFDLMFGSALGSITYGVVCNRLWHNFIWYPRVNLLVLGRLIDVDMRE